MTRIYTIDYLKTLCAFLVICIHTYCAYQNFILPLARVAVPCFFMISEYLQYNGESIGKQHLKKSILNVLRITIWSTLLFIVIKELLYFHYNKSFYIPSQKEILNCVVFNENPFGGHLWYLNAYFYVLLIVYAIEKCQKWKYLFVATPILLIGDLVFGKYSMLLFNREFPFIYVRNFIFVGIPYFTLGVLLKKYYRTIHTHLSQKILIIACIFFSFTSFFEKYILLYIERCPTREHYLSTTFLSIALFLLFISFKQSKPNILSLIGEKYSLFIYILHPLFLTFFGILNRHASNIWNNIYYWSAPFIIFCSTTILICTIKKIKFIK